MRLSAKGVDAKRLHAKGDSSERLAVSCTLISDVVRDAGQVRLRLTGSSMLPAVWPGDLVTVTGCDLADISLGQIVLFRREGRLIAHRVVGRVPGHLITRGDSVPDSDSPVDAAEVIGRITDVVRRGRSVPLRRTTLQRVVSRIFCRSTLCTRFALRLRDRLAAVGRSPAFCAGATNCSPGGQR